MLEIRLERGALKAKKGLERGAILEIAGAWSAEDKIGGWSAERQGQKGLERGALFTPGPLPEKTSELCRMTSHICFAQRTALRIEAVEVHVLRAAIEH